MGQFSWLDCIDETQIVDNKHADVYVLVPKEFGGGHIHETYYDGYGNFGGHDIYDLIAEWNREKLSHHMLKDVLTKSWSEGWDGSYIIGLKHQIKSVERLMDYRNGELSEREMKEKYGDDWKRIIGIDIGCYDDQNAALPYPIKITHDPNAVYEDCSPSLSDPDQGWETDYDDWYDEDDDWYDEDEEDEEW